MNKLKIAHTLTFRLTVVVVFALLLAGCFGGQNEAEPTADVTVMPPEATQGINPTEPADAGAACDLALPGPSNWEIVLCEQFDDNQNNWQVETQDNPYSKYTSTITDGKFVVDYTAKGFGGFQRTALTWFNIGNEKDFALSVKGSMDSTFKDTSWGIAFRGDEDSFFLFSIMNDGTYAFEIFENNGWVPLITPKIFNGIRLGEENTLRVEAGGQDFYFSINGETVNQFNGGLLQGSEILLVVSAKEGVSTTYSFDDVVLQR